MQPTTGKSARYQALDAWRGVVCLVVVLEHAGVALWTAPGSSTGFEGLIRRGIVGLLGLNLGAPLFFVISGYCIASSLDSTRRKGTASFHFLARRLWRIFPPYWASVAVIALMVMAFDRLGLDWLHRTYVGLELASPGDLGWTRWVGNLTLTETWRPHLAGPEALLLNRVAWALCYQEQFYLICFLVLVLTPRRLYGALGAATVGIVGFRVFAWDSGRLDTYFGFFPDLWHEFAVGLALYWRINVASTWASRRAVELGLIGLLAVGLLDGFVSTAAAAGFGLLLLAFHRWDDRIARVRQLDGLRGCGRRSYAIYLIHLPVCTFGNAALAAAGLSAFWPRALVMIPAVTAGSVAAGWVFYHLLDRRFTRLPSLRVPTTDRTSAVEEAGTFPVVPPSGLVAVRVVEGEFGRVGPMALRMVLIAVIALGTIGLAGDEASGAKARPKEQADRPATRSITLGGVADAWSKAHRSYVERARRTDADVVFLGDSITHAWGDEGRDDLGRPSWLEDFAPLRAVNFGIPGDQTQHLLHRVEDGELAGHPRLAVVLIGTNNLGEGHSPEETASGIAAVADAIRAASPATRVLLVGLLPREDGPGQPPCPEVTRVNQIIQGWAAQAGVDYLDVGAALLRPDGRLKWEATQDGLHPSPVGYRLLADRLKAPIRERLGKD